MLKLLDFIFLRLIKKGYLEVIFPNHQHKFYGSIQNKNHACIELLTYNICMRLLINPGLAFGEGYMEGSIRPVACSIYDVLNILMDTDLQGDHMGEKVNSFLRYSKRFWTQFNRISQSQKNVVHHYDLKKDLYTLFLDKDMQYSCAYFKTGNETLEEAQFVKKKHIADKLFIHKYGLRILDIGCGWGGMALFLAKEYGAQVTGITLSEEQLQVAKKRAHEKNLEDKVHFYLMDYRLVHGVFDRIVSIGMFEHVGIHYYLEFFKEMKKLLTPDGVMLLHSIGRSDGPGSTNAWINKYIFPGGYSPSLSETFTAVEKSGLWVTDCEILRLHYAKTIHFWLENFKNNKNKIINMYDERFYRMFELYLSAAELCFYYHHHMNFQLQISPSLTAVPITRDYMIKN